VRTFASRREEGSVSTFPNGSPKSLNGLFRFAYRRVSVSSVVIPTLLIPQLVGPCASEMFFGESGAGPPR